MNSSYVGLLFLFLSSRFFLIIQTERNVTAQEDSALVIAARLKAKSNKKRKVSGVKNTEGPSSAKSSFVIGGDDGSDAPKKKKKAS